MFGERNRSPEAWRGGLTSADVDRIHEESLEILAKTGFRLTDPEAQALCQEAGAKVDCARGIVKLPPELVEWALKQCPHKLTRYALNGEPYEFQKGVMYQCTGTHRIKVLDYGAENPRAATCRDLEMLVRVGDALPGIFSVSPCVTPVDAQPGPTELTELEILFLNTGKHIYNSPYTAQEARWTIDMVEMLSTEALTEKPTVTIRANPTTPLVLVNEVAQVIITGARRGAILALAGLCAAGTTSPVTLAGTILLQNAEFLFELVLAQLAREGAPVDYQVASTIADLRTGLVMFGAIEKVLITGGLMAMAERYDLPFSADQSSDATTINVDAGLQKMLSFAYKMAIGLDFLRNAGDLARANVMSCEQMVIDHEIAEILGRFWQGIRADDEALATEIIQEVGPGGMFLTHEHTLKHCRNGEHYPYPPLYPADSGGPTLLEWAHERVKEILRTHDYKLPDEKTKQLQRYVAEERRHLYHTPDGRS